jgi:hypothetical protein
LTPSEIKQKVIATYGELHRGDFAGTISFDRVLELKREIIELRKGLSAQERREVAAELDEKFGPYLKKLRDPWFLVPLKGE